APSQDTVKLANGGQTIQRTLPRHTVWLAQTPQAFERTLLERAHGLHGKISPRPPLKKGGSRGDLVTDDSQLVEHLGVRVKLVASPPDNLKVTVPMDLKMAESLLAKGKIPPHPPFSKGG